jgi:hypothetical protein
MTEKPVSRRIFVGDSMSTANFQALGVAAGKGTGVGGRVEADIHSASTANLQVISSIVEKLAHSPTPQSTGTANNTTKKG